MAALPQAAAGSSTSVPSARASRQVGGDLRVVDERIRAAADVGPGRVREVGEGECPADDRDRIARLQPGLAVGPPTTPAAEPRRIARGARVGHGQQPATADRLVDLGRPRRTSLPDGETSRFVARRVRLALEADRRVEPRAARKDPHAPGRVADAEADRLFLLVPVAQAAALLDAADRRAVVDAGHALEQGDEGQLGRLDDAAHPHLAGRQRGDRRGGRVADADERPIAAETAREQDEPGDDAEAGEGRHSRIGQRLHAAIVRDRPVSPNGATASTRRPPARPRARSRPSATRSRGRSRGSIRGPGRRHR